MGSWWFKHDKHILAFLSLKVLVFYLVHYTRYISIIWALFKVGYHLSVGTTAFNSESLINLSGINKFIQIFENLWNWFPPSLLNFLLIKFSKFWKSLVYMPSPSGFKFIICLSYHADIFLQIKCSPYENRVFVLFIAAWRWHLMNI